MPILKSSKFSAKDRFAFAPIQNYDEPWTYEKLYKKYGITEEEIAFIESMISPMENSQNQDSQGLQNEQDFDYEIVANE